MIVPVLASMDDSFAGEVFVHVRGRYASILVAGPADCTMFAPRG